MPELPEVEVTRRSFADRIAGHRVRGVGLGKPLRWPLGCEVASLIGASVHEVVRRGKYLWVDLGGPQKQGGLLLHLGMSGSLSFSADPGPAGPHDHFDLLTTGGVLRLHDPRRFGAVVWSPSRERGMAARLLSTLGVEPFSEAWTAAHLHQGLAGRSIAVKQALLGGHIVVGVGNIYASEALFHARIHPATAAGRIGVVRAGRLVQAVREVLAQAVDAGGSSLKDFRDAHGQSGHFQNETAVYGRQGQPCRICQTPIRRMLQGQRATYWCPQCQRR